MACALAICGIFNPAFSSETLHELLARMQIASADLDYEGTYVYSFGNTRDVVQIVHTSNEGGFKERLVSMNGVAQEIVQTNSGVWCYFPETKEGYYKSKGTNSSYRSPAIDPSKVDQLRRNYQIRLRESKRIVGRDVTRVTFIPEDEYRYGLDLWIDLTTGLVLRSDLLNVRGQMVDSYMFVELRVGEDVAGQAMSPVNIGTDYVWTFDQNLASQISADESAWTVQSVPDGYRLIEHLRTHTPVGAGEYEHIVFSDGLSSVSVFIRKDMDSQDKYLDGLSRLGAVHAYGRIVDAYNVVVMGEVPDPAVRSIAESIVFAQSPD